jgi:DNA-binding response OmpR family regulator
MNEIIAIVDDEPDILELITMHLNRANFETKEYSNAKKFLNSLERHIPDLVILDLMLPDMDGIEICRQLRKEEKYSQLPIIMLTARADESDTILGLELGADDYVTKPFSPKELIARVKAVLRRKQRSEKEADIINVKDLLLIDLQKYEVKVKGEKVNLTPTEFRILTYLADKIGWVFTREQILDYLWGHDKAVLDRTIDVHIKHLREKLGDVGKYIKNIRGVGYKLDI